MIFLLSYNDLSYLASGDLCDQLISSYGNYSVLSAQYGGNRKKTYIIPDKYLPLTADFCPLLPVSFLYFLDRNMDPLNQEMDAERMSTFHLLTYVIWKG